MNPQNTVSLILNTENFDLIASGEKKKEYRSLSDRNIALFVDDPDGEADFKPIEFVLFYLGYRKDRKKMLVEVIDLDIEETKEWGPQIVISLGNILPG